MIRPESPQIKSQRHRTDEQANDRAAAEHPRDARQVADVQRHKQKEHREQQQIDLRRI